MKNHEKHENPKIRKRRKHQNLQNHKNRHIRKNYIAPKFKCLQSLKKGELDSLTLAYHESEIMMRVVERSEIPIFILHDCLICQQSEALDVGKAMQAEYIAYCKEQSWTPVAPAYSIDVKGKETLYFSGYKVPTYNRSSK